MQAEASFSGHSLHAECGLKCVRVNRVYNAQCHSDKYEQITATRYLPSEFVPAAKAAHEGEAVLAVLAIIIWHMYGVNIKHYNRSMFTGKVTEEEMVHEHPKELEDIQSGRAD